MVLEYSRKSDSAKPSYDISTMIVESWKNIPHQPSLERQDPGTLSDAEALTHRYATNKTCRERQSVLAGIGQRLIGKEGKLLLQCGAIVFSLVAGVSSAQLIASRFGPFAVPATAVLAIGLALSSDKALARALTNRRKKEITLAAIDICAQSHEQFPPINNLGETAHAASMTLIQNVETESFAKKFPSNTVLSVVLNGAEYIGTLWLVSLMGLPGGLLVEAIVSLIPLGVQAVIALIESEFCLLPEACAELLRLYVDYHWDWEYLSLEEAEEQNHRIQKVDLALKFLPHGDPTGQLKNLGMALADLDIKFYTQRKHRLTQEGLRKIQALREQLRQELSIVSSRCPHEGVRMVNAEFEQSCAHWVKEERQRLEKEFLEDIEAMRMEYAMEIRQCDEDIARAWERYRCAEENWRESQNDHGLPGN